MLFIQKPSKMSSNVWKFKFDEFSLEELILFLMRHFLRKTNLIENYMVNFLETSCIAIINDYITQNKNYCLHNSKSIDYTFFRKNPVGQKYKGCWCVLNKNGT